MRSAFAARPGSHAVGWAAAALLVVCVSLLSACGPSGSPTRAQRSRAQLDAELRFAHQIGLPQTALKPIEAQEAQAASGQGGWGYDYNVAAARYEALYHQVLDLERQNLATIRSKAAQDIVDFGQLLSERRGQGFVEVDAYQARLTQATEEYNSAQTSSDFGHVAIFAETQTQALRAMWPAYLQLQSLRSTLTTLNGVGIQTGAANAEYQADLAEFRTASSSDRYDHLKLVIEGQIMQLVADQTEALPYVGLAMLTAFQGQVDLLRQYGEQYADFQRAHDTFANELSHAHTLADYLTVAQAINRVSAQMTFPLEHGKAYYDLVELTTVIHNMQAQDPVLGYEYSDTSRGIGDVWSQYYSSWSIWDYQAVDERAVIMMACVREMLDNLHDPTPPWLPHRADLELMRTLGIIHYQVTMVSLAEQTARLYENGKLVYWSYVTTGRFERPSPPGWHVAMFKATHILFLPTEPIGSPLRGYPTPINYGVYYADSGFYLHDGWWRTTFGPGSNFPHPYDGAAFNGGSHGCINFPLQNMAYYYNLVQQGTPIILY